jgi:phage tail sheath protein FI
MRISMAITTSYPGVYIEEVPSGARPIEGVATSITAFLGRTLRGPTGAPGTARSWAEFQRLYGGLWASAALGYAVQHFFNNGGGEALIVRLHNGATVATATVPAGGLTLIAASQGAWGNGLRARVDVPDPASKSFDLSAKDVATGMIETFQKLSIDPNDPRFIAAILVQESQLVRVDGTAPANVPPASAAPAAGGDAFTDPTATRFVGGGDGADVTDAQIPDGLRMLDQADLFNLLCIPPLKRSGGDVGKPSWDAAIAYAKSRRAFVIVDPAEHWTTANDVLDASTGVTSVVAAEDNAAMYFPRIVAPDPLNDGQPSGFAPSGAVAGVFARIDAQHGVWKAPAGNDADLRDVSSLAHTLSDAENGLLNSAGVNCLRTFSGSGNVVWGARTLQGADTLASQWKYIPVRRLAAHIQESIYRNTKWAVFEPNAEPLWADLRLYVGAFMHTLFTQGALQGQSAQQAYYVQCGQNTTTRVDIDRGIVNVVVGFAPVKPAEFVIIRIQQMLNHDTVDS